LVEFAEAFFRDQQKLDDSSTVGEHEASLRRQGAIAKPVAEELPSFEPEIAYLWEMWRELHRARGSGGMASNPLSYTEIEAYGRLIDEALEPWEARAIRAVDDAYMASLVAGNEGGSAANG
jgi:hypothetical protein